MTLEILRIPALIVKLPLKVFKPVSIVVPVPDWVKTPEPANSDITPERVSVPEPALLTVPEFAMLLENVYVSVRLNLKVAVGTTVIPTVGNEPVVPLLPI